MTYIFLAVMVHSTFLPTTLGAWAAIVAALLGAIAAILGVLNRRKIQEVHVLVNSNLDKVKTNLQKVQGQLEEMTLQRDQLQDKTGVKN